MTSALHSAAVTSCCDNRAAAGASAPGPISTATESVEPPRPAEPPSVSARRAAGQRRCAAERLRPLALLAGTRAGPPGSDPSRNGSESYDPRPVARTRRPGASPERRHAPRRFAPRLRGAAPRRRRPRLRGAGRHRPAVSRTRTPRLGDSHPDSDIAAQPSHPDSNIAPGLGHRCAVLLIGISLRTECQGSDRMGLNRLLGQGPAPASPPPAAAAAAVAAVAAAVAAGYARAPAAPPQQTAAAAPAPPAARPRRPPPAAAGRGPPPPPPAVCGRHAADGWGPNTCSRVASGLKFKFTLSFKLKWCKNERSLSHSQPRPSAIAAWSNPRRR